jgi:hypothetical protein
MENPFVFIRRRSPSPSRSIQGALDKFLFPSLQDNVTYGDAKRADYLYKPQTCFGGIGEKIYFLSSTLAKIERIRERVNFYDKKISYLKPP